MAALAVVLVGLCACLFSAQDAEPAGGDRTAYEAAAARAGDDAAAHIRLALWCEARGMAADRARQLAIAAEKDPRNVLARGLAGSVRYRGEWQPKGDVERSAHEDPTRDGKLRAYIERRSAAAHTADDQLKLATWCAENGLKQQAVAHYTELSRIDPGASPSGSTSASRSRAGAGLILTRRRHKGWKPSAKGTPTSGGKPGLDGCGKVSKAPTPPAAPGHATAWPK